MARGEVKYRMSLDTKGVQEGAAKAKKEIKDLGDTAGKSAAKASDSFAKFRKEIEGLGGDFSSKLGKAGSILESLGPAGQAAAVGIGAGVLAATAVAAAIVSATKAAAEYADQLMALHDKTGLSTDALQQLEVAAKLGNTSIDALASATNKMQRGIVDGNDAFRKLGLSLSDLKRMTPEEQLKATAEAIVRIQNPAQQTAAAIAVMGKSGAENLPALKALASGAAELGGALSGNSVKAAGDMADQLDLMGIAMERAWLQFGAAVAGSPEVQAAIKDITEAFVDLAVWVQKNGPEIKAFFGIIAEGAREGIRIVRELAGWMGKLSPGLGALGGMMGGDVSGWYQDKLKAARQGAGVSSGGVQVGRKVNGKFVEDSMFSGKGDDKAAKDAATIELHRIDAVKKARIEEHKTRLKMQDEIDKRQQASLQFDLKMMGEAAHAKADMLKDQEARQGEQDLIDQQAAEDLARFKADAAAEAFAKVQSGIQGVSQGLLNMGDMVGGVFGKILQGAGAAVGAFGEMRASLAQMKAPGGGFGGFLNKASGALGLAGAAFSAFGAIKGLFGGKSKEQKAAEAAERKQKIEDTTRQLGDLQKKLDQLKFDKVVAGVSGIAALFHHAAESADLTQARMDRLGILGAAMFQDLKRQGLSTVEAMKQMGPALDEALKAAEKSGLTLGGTLGMLADFQQKVSANEGLVSAAEGLSSVMDALRATGSLTQETFNAVQGELGDVFAELTAKGFTADQALALLAPTLLQIRDAAKDGKIAIDEQTAALIAQAEAGGHFEGIKDPMKEMVEIQKMMLELWSAIAKMQGVTLPESLQAYINTLHQASAAAAGIGVPGGATGGKAESADSGPDGSTQSAGGFWNPNMPHGPLAGGGTNLVVHPGEEVSVTPRGHKGGGMGNVVLNVDGRAFAKVSTGLQRKNRGGMRSGTKRYAS